MRPRCFIAGLALARAWLMSLAALAPVALLACAPSPKTDPDAVKIGLLLPYTGASSATSNNFERAVLFARDEINSGGGVKGRPVEVVEADTHSDPALARHSVHELIAAGVVVVIGPESAEIAAEIKPMLDASDIVFLSPLVGAADDDAVDCATPWFRLAPSARALGEALAKQAWGDLVQRAALFHAEDAYDQALGAAFQNRFVSLGGTIAVDEVLRADAESYADSIPATDLAHVDAQVLSATPRPAALLVNELRFIDEQYQTKWYLSPLLKTELLLENVTPLALEGASGVTPKIFDTSPGFPAAFAARWSGDAPLDGAFFYYDAMALLAFGLERAELVDGQLRAPELRAAITASTGSRGESGAWNQIGDSLGRLRAGVDMNYSGLTGPIQLQDCGGRRSGESSRWWVHGGEIEQ